MAGTKKTIQMKECTNIEHVRLRPEVYTGPKVLEKKLFKVFDIESKTVKQKEILLCDALEKIFFEILNNSTDNTLLANQHDVDPGEITVRMTKHIIEVTNGGYPFEILKTDEGEWHQTIAFGRMRTGTHYGENKDEIKFSAGCNGIGSKATCYLSSSFETYVEDPVNNRTFYQKWSKGDSVLGPIVKDKTVKNTQVRVIFKADFEYFNIPHYDPAVFELYALHALDASFTTKTKVHFHYNMDIDSPDEIPSSITMNALTFDVGNPKLYLNLVEPQPEKVKYFEHIIMNGKTISTEVVFIDSENPVYLSFVNGINTREGGVHVDEALRTFAKIFLDRVNGPSSKQSVASRKIDARGGATEQKKIQLEFGEVKHMFSYIININIHSPSFNGNMKSKLLHPKIKFDFDNKSISGITEWRLYDRLVEKLEDKKLLATKKTDGKKVNKISLDNFIDANYAGKKDSNKCTLIIVEGKSASNYPNKLISNIENGRNYIGIYAVRGKPINALRHDQKVNDNKEFITLKQILGLRETTDGSPTDYTLAKNFSSLRYGKVLIMADSDADGYHIVGLLICNFFIKFPSLIRRNDFVFYWRTPVVRIVTKTETIRFYSTHEYDKWVGDNPEKSRRGHTKYFKGLGSCNDKEIKDDFIEDKQIALKADDFVRTGSSIKMAFSPIMSAFRKRWIEKGLVEILDSSLRQQQICDYIEKEMIVHPLDNLKRSLASLTDGLKESHRKMLHTFFALWKRKGKCDPTVGMKIAVLAGKITSDTAYKHGEASLCRVITESSQAFVGSNNLPLVQSDGQTGTRCENGADAAAPRYVFVCPTWFWAYIFRPEDDKLLEYVFDDGMKCEPHRFYPIICWPLVNGTVGIATGHSSFIPPHNPLEIILWHMLTLKKDKYGEPPPPLPYWRGFNGSIRIESRSNAEKFIDIHNTKDKKKKKVIPDEPINTSPDDDDEDDDTESTDVNAIINQKIEFDDAEDEQDTENEVDTSIVNESPVKISKKIIVVEGTYIWDGKTIVITEIPLRSINSYCKFLDRLQEKKFIKGYNRLDRDDFIKIELTLNRKDNGEYPRGELLKRLCLYRVFSMANMVLLDDDDRPHKYKDVSQMLNEFHEKRLKLYSVRKSKEIVDLKHDVDKINDKVKLIRACVSGQLKYVKRPREEIREDIKKNIGVDPDIFDTIRVTHLTKEELDRLELEKEKLENHLEEYTKMAPADIWFRELEELLLNYRKIYPKETVRFIKKSPF